MTTPQRLDYETVLRIVRQWSPEQRFGLVQEVLNTLAPGKGEARTPQTPTLARTRSSRHRPNGAV